MSILQFLADAVLVAHFCIAAFVVGGLGMVLVGNFLRWRWVNGWWFRLSHLVAISVVVAESWLGVTCPLTTLESWLRERSGALPYAGGFIEFWVQRMLFYEAPGWVFTAVYSVFGSLVVAAWYFFPPGTVRAPRAGKPGGHGLPPTQQEQA